MILGVEQQVRRSEVRRAIERQKDEVLTASGFAAYHCPPGNPCKECNERASQAEKHEFRGNRISQGHFPKRVAQPIRSEREREGQTPSPPIDLSQSRHNQHKREE